MSYHEPCECKSCKKDYKKNNCECSKKSKNDYDCEKCIDRLFLCKSVKLKKKLAELNDHRPYCNSQKNRDECKFKDHFYNGSFHKGLTHDSQTGHLTKSKDFENFVHYVTHNCQKDLALIPLAPGAEFKLVDPLASLSTPLIGSDFCYNHISTPPRLCSKEGAAEMVELYCHLIARDSPFINYDTDSVIAKVLDYMNVPDIVNCLPDYVKKGSFDIDNLFRGASPSDVYGPYISQLLYLNIPCGALTVEQKYELYPTKQQCLIDGLVNEWGRNNKEMISLANASTVGFPAIPPRNKLEKKYIYSGRALAEAVHNDPVYQFFYQACLILSGLGATPNPAFPVYPNQGNFLTGTGNGSIQCLLADVTGLSLKHCWFWKWQVFRKLRPEVFSLWIDNVKNGRVSNVDNYDIRDTVLNSLVLNDVKACNNAWGFADSYTLNSTYREGSPLHPAYPSGHATISGACCTILKMLFNCEQNWSSLSGLNPLNRRIVPLSVNAKVSQADSTGVNLIDYTETDVANMTVYGEIDKLAYNIAIGRNWAGIHYRTDAVQGILLGEQVAIEYMKDYLSSIVNNNLDCSPPELKFRKFDGSLETIKPRLCKE